MIYPKVRKWLSLIKNTPLHPQWLVFRNETRRFKDAAINLKGYVLDIGCSEKKLKRYLHADCLYIGMDYPQTATSLYKTKPVLFADAQSLPFQGEAIDTAVMLETLEHVPDPKAVLSEIHRVLRPNGCLVLSMPFLYPVHDSPYDFQRFTIHGLRFLCQNCGFKIEDERYHGHPVVTACLLLNIALTNMILKSFSQRHPAVLLILFLPFIVPFINIVSWLCERTSPNDSLMPYGHTVTMFKEQSEI
jgi:SAM-dependent methyltransferase